MTCIVAVIENNKCIMGADSCGSNEDNSYVISQTPKILKKSNMLIGVCDSYRIINLINEFTPPNTAKTIPNYSYLIKFFIPELQKFLKKHETISEHFNLLIGFKNEIYEIGSDYGVILTPEWGSSIGSGSVAALGSLYTSSKSSLSCQEKVMIALQSAEAIMNNVKGPFLIYEL